MTHVQASGEPSSVNTKDPQFAQQQMAEDMQQGQAACKGDMNCLVQLAQEFAQQSAMTSCPPAAGAAPTANLDDEEEAPEEERYLDYFGYEGCPGEIHIRINNTSEGATADVAGMVPFKQADSADYRGNAHDLRMQCLGSTLPIAGTKADPAPAGVGGDGAQISGQIKVRSRSA